MIFIRIWKCKILIINKITKRDIKIRNINWVKGTITSRTGRWPSTTTRSGSSLTFATLSSSRTTPATRNSSWLATSSQDALRSLLSESQCCPFWNWTTSRTPKTSSGPSPWKFERTTVRSGTGLAATRRSSWKRWNGIGKMLQTSERSVGGHLRVSCHRKSLINFSLGNNLRNL